MHQKTIFGHFILSYTVIKWIFISFCRRIPESCPFLSVINVVALTILSLFIIMTISAQMDHPLLMWFMLRLHSTLFDTFQHAGLQPNRFHLYSYMR